ncbi:MAG: carbohydrate-binding family 9-like protein [Polyangiaceae bacterium]|nr:carbohydrate-binding family 9-like protein [Polyangiaceae bacterium]
MMLRPIALAVLVVGVGACRAGERADDKKPRPVPNSAAVPDNRRVIKEMVVPTLPAGQTITIDGKLDEGAWQQAASSGEFVDVGTGVTNPRLPVQGSVRLLWDDTYFYVAFDVKDASIRGGFPADAKDPHLWERDTVEIMIDPDGDGDNKDYYEIQIGPQNLVFDSQFDNYNQPRGGPNGPFGHQDWSAALESAVVLNGKIDDDVEKDEGYVVEAKIPWSSFTKASKVPPESGSFWRMNFYAMQNNGGVAWSPILGMGNFHKAARFGRVKWQR